MLSCLCRLHNSRIGYMELKDVVKKVISGLEKRQEEELDISRAWRLAAGKKASAHTRPVFLKKKRLIVNVGDSSWLYKLTLEKEAIKKKFNKKTKGKKKVDQVQFRIGEI